MIERIINLTVVAIVLAIVYYIATLIISALGLPGVVLTLVMVLLLLVFIAYLLRAFNISL